MAAPQYEARRGDPGMRVILTERARRYLTRETGIDDPAVFILQAQCLCQGLRPEVSLRSRSEVSSLLLGMCSEETTGLERIPVFIDKRLKKHLGHSLTIDADNALGTYQLKLAA